MELQLVDNVNFELKCGIDEIMARLPDDLVDHVKPEIDAMLPGNQHRRLPDGE